MVRRFGFAPFLCACLALAAPDAASGQGRVIQGRVADSTGMAVAYAGLYERSVGRVAATDSGTFRLQLKGNGRVRLEVRRIGFQPATIDVPAGGDTTLAIVMSPVENMLPSMVVQVSRTLRGLENAGSTVACRTASAGSMWATSSPSRTSSGGIRIGSPSCSTTCPVCV